MKRALTLCLALLVALCAVTTSTAIGQTKTEPAAKSETKADAKKADKAPAKKGPMDINTASVEELQTLSGIGEAFSKKIVENRPYARKDELVKKNIVPQATYDKIKEQIIAKQAPGEKKAEKPAPTKTDKKADAKEKK